MQQDQKNSGLAQSGQEGMGRVQENDSMQNRGGSQQDISQVDQQEGNLEPGETGDRQDTPGLDREQDSQSRH